MLPKEDIEFLKERARQSGESLGAVVRKAIKKDIDGSRKVKKSGPQVLVEAARWARKKNTKGPKDLGSNDEYLYGKITS